MNRSDQQSAADYEREALADIQTRWFGKHVPRIHSTMLGNEQITRIKWAQPGTNCFAVEYVLSNGTLYVSGDIGEAVYRWNSSISLPFLATCSLDYFLGKCCASETGRRYTEWDDEVARYRLRDLIMETDGLDPECVDAIQEAIPGPDRDSCRKAAQEVYDLEGDAELASAVSSAGEVPNMRGIAHWIGLRMIHKILSPTEPTKA